MRRAHPDELDQERIRTDLKLRWKEEEIHILAKKEAELMQKNVRFMNIELAKHINNRTQEAIKKARQKQTYKDLVRRYLNAVEEPASSSSRSLPSPPVHNNTNAAMLEYALSINTANSTLGFNCQRLNEIVRDAHRVGEDITCANLSDYLDSIFPQERPRPGRQQPGARTRGRRSQRRHDYAQTQIHWDRHKGRCVKRILKGPDRGGMPAKEIMVEYWQGVMNTESSSAWDNEYDEPQVTPLEGIWVPILVDDLMKNPLDRETSAGPDGVSARQLRSMPIILQAIIINLVLWCGMLPLQWRTARTIFIPKTTAATAPTDFRPITIPSVFVRQINSIIAKRVAQKVNWDKRQHGFMPTDGCADNATLVDIVLRDSHNTYHSSCMSSLDVGKAYDTLSHNAMIYLMKCYGLPDGLISFVENAYRTGGTRLVGDGWYSEIICPKRGVKQGDPLSPIIFNLAIDRLLKSLPEGIGYQLGNTLVNAAAYADDLILFASTPNGLQILLDHTAKTLQDCGLILNSAKCQTISIKGQPKGKCTVVEHRSFKINGRSIPCLKRSEKWKYLGITFTADGRSWFDPRDELTTNLERLTHAPLKPQQRLYALKSVLIPQLYHKLTLGNIKISILRKCDVILRNMVRRWLRLPHDVPVGFFYSSIKDGGLGIQCLRWVAPLLRSRRLSSINIGDGANTQIELEINKAKRRLSCDGINFNSFKNITDYYLNKLKASVDGFGLREAWKVPQAHSWVGEPSRFLTGRDYINLIHLRINALPSKSRTTRGRQRLDRECRAGCGVPETTNHIVQGCHRTHAARLKRHNAVAAYITRGLITRGYTVEEEPNIRTESGLYKPDLVVSKDQRAIVIDALVSTDGVELDQAHLGKVRKYNRAEIVENVRRKFNANEVIVTSATLNWRGIWSKMSSAHLLSLGMIKRRDLKVISTRVGVGSIAAFRVFNKSTIVRSGIG